LLNHVPPQLKLFLAQKIQIKGLQTLFDPNSIRNYAKIKKSKNLKEIKITNGVRLKVDLNDIIGFRSAINGKWDDTALNILKKFDPEKTTFIDVGANIGTTCLPAASFGYKVIAYEANPLMASYLLQNISLNYNLKIITFPFALGNIKNETVEIFENIGNQGSSSIIKDWSPGKQTKIKYETYITTLDESLKTLNLRKNDDLIIKLDVEGYELEVLKGAKNTIKQFKPIILFENNPTSMYSVNAIRRELPNYIFYAVTENLVFTQANLKKRYENIFAIHNSQIILANKKFFFNFT
jgi:FkbM family methyltransferase